MKTRTQTIRQPQLATSAGVRRFWSLKIGEKFFFENVLYIKVSCLYRRTPIGGMYLLTLPWCNVKPLPPHSSAKRMND